MYVDCSTIAASLSSFPYLRARKSSPSVGPSEEVSNLKEENDQLRCQLNAYENENELLKTENKTFKDTRQKEVNMMQNMMRGNFMM